MMTDRIPDPIEHVEIALEYWPHTRENLQAIHDGLKDLQRSARRTLILELLAEDDPEQRLAVVDYWTFWGEQMLRAHEKFGEALAAAAGL